MSFLFVTKQLKRLKHTKNIKLHRELSRAYGGKPMNVHIHASVCMHTPWHFLTNKKNGLDFGCYRLVKYNHLNFSFLVYMYNNNISFYHSCLSVLPLSSSSSMTFLHLLNCVHTKCIKFCNGFFFVLRFLSK